ncbi:MAG TPA: type II toxin-antitoxin system VapC family toxin [Caldithrix abyssi]|uniref:Type II toxin-antitoxin system VapC family toxin n=1 Tax=Caldithrix abyssi TaxID=187145 RepID=A0A7V4WV93_CALAY|nr:type II toxin-antitoxin system VapC family toxin [Caldithrix abyssi]
MVTVDTHIMIWDALSQDKLSRKAREALLNANNSDGIIICDISLWEISMLMEKKRLEIDAEYPEFIDLLLRSRNYIVQPITPDIAYLSAKLYPKINADPADRLIAATSIYRKAPLITADRNLCQADSVISIW